MASNQQINQGLSTACLTHYPGRYVPQLFGVSGNLES